MLFLLLLCCISLNLWSSDQSNKSTKKSDTLSQEIDNLRNRINVLKIDNTKEIKDDIKNQISTTQQDLKDLEDLLNTPTDILMQNNRNDENK